MLRHLSALLGQRNDSSWMGGDSSSLGQRDKTGFHTPTKQQIPHNTDRHLCNSGWQITSDRRIEKTNWAHDLTWSVVYQKQCTVIHKSSSFYGIVCLHVWPSLKWRSRGIVFPNELWIWSLRFSWVKPGCSQMKWPIRSSSMILMN